MKSMNAPAVFHYFETNDKLARSRIESLFEGKTIHLDNRYSVRIDSPRHSKMQQNFHVQHKGSDICIINKDGTMSHRSSSDKLPAYVKDMLRSRRFFWREHFSTLAKKSNCKMGSGPKRLHIEGRNLLSHRARNGNPPDFEGTLA